MADPIFKLNNSRLASIFNGQMPSPIVANSTPATIGFTAATRSLPMDTGQYSSPVIQQAQKPVVPQVPPAQTNNPGSQGPAPIDYSRYTNPVTGQVMSPQEYAAFLAQRMTGGSVPGYAGDALTQGPQTADQLRTTARGLNNERNDIAVGEADPYNVASKSGIAYSPTELKAIEKAYAGIYDPALNDVFNKLDAKEKQDAADRELKNKLAAMAEQHKYDVALKQTPSGDSTSSIDTSAGYVEGADPIVDSWVQRISRGEAKLSDITGVKNQGLKNMVNMGLNTVKARNAKAGGALTTVNNINNLLQNPDLNNISGFLGQTGITSLFGKAKTAKTEYDQIIGAIQLAKAGAIQGQGAVSDFERSVLSAAAAAISRGQSDEEFRDALVKLRGATMTASGIEAPVRVTDPTTGETIESKATTEEINDLIAEGNIVTYIE